MITEEKGKPEDLSQLQILHNQVMKPYRARAEHLIAEVVEPRETLHSSKFRGDFDLLAAITKIAVHMVGLQERMKGPRYDVFGPWPVCPDTVLARCRW